MEDVNVDRRIILKWIFKKWEGEAWSGLIWLKIDRWLFLVSAVKNLRVP